MMLVESCGIIKWHQFNGSGYIMDQGHYSNKFILFYFMTRVDIGWLTYNNTSIISVTFGIIMFVNYLYIQAALVEYFE